MVIMEIPFTIGIVGNSGLQLVVIVIVVLAIVIVVSIVGNSDY